MRTETYRQELLLALRLRDVPGPRIAEVLAEVDSHLLESGEDPVEAFGPPRRYADKVINASHSDGGDWRVAAVVSALAIAVWAGSGAYLLGSGLVALAADRPRVLGMSPLVATLVGAMLLGGILLWQSTATRRREQRVLDPRTGLDMTPPIPAWARVGLFVVPVALLLVGVVAGLLER